MENQYKRPDHSGHTPLDHKVLGLFDPMKLVKSIVKSVTREMKQVSEESVETALNNPAGTFSVSMAAHANSLRLLSKTTAAIQDDTKYIRKIIKKLGAALDSGDFPGSGGGSNLPFDLGAAGALLGLGGWGAKRGFRGARNAGTRSYLREAERAKLSENPTEDYKQSNRSEPKGRPNPFKDKGLPSAGDARAEALGERAKWGGRASKFIKWGGRGLIGADALLEAYQEYQKSGSFGRAGAVGGGVLGGALAGGAAVAPFAEAAAVIPYAGWLAALGIEIIGMTVGAIGGKRAATDLYDFITDPNKTKGTFAGPDPYKTLDSSQLRKIGLERKYIARGRTGIVYYEKIGSGQRKPAGRGRGVSSSDASSPSNAAIINMSQTIINNTSGTSLFAQRVGGRDNASGMYIPMGTTGYGKSYFGAIDVSGGYKGSSPGSTASIDPNFVPASTTSPTQKAVGSYIPKPMRSHHPAMAGVKQGQYRPQYKLSPQDLSDDVVNTIASEALNNPASIDGVANVMLNRVGNSGWKNLHDVAMHPGQFSHQQKANPKKAALIRQRLTALASGTVPDVTQGATQFRGHDPDGTFYPTNRGAGKSFARDWIKQGSVVVGGNAYARHETKAGPYVSTGGRTAYAQAIRQNIPGGYKGEPPTQVADSSDKPYHKASYEMPPKGTLVTKEMLKNRPGVIRGDLSFPSGNKYHFGTGSATNKAHPSAPYGYSKIMPETYGPKTKKMVFSTPGFWRYDPKIGKYRDDIVIHAGRTTDFKKLASWGCFAIDPKQWPKFEKELKSYMKEHHGNAYLNFHPDGTASITDKPEIPGAPTITADKATKMQKEAASQGHPPPFGGHYAINAPALKPHVTPELRKEAKIVLAKAENNRAPGPTYGKLAMAENNRSPGPKYGRLSPAENNRASQGASYRLAKAENNRAPTDRTTKRPVLAGSSEPGGIGGILSDIFLKPKKRGNLGFGPNAQQAETQSMKRLERFQKIQRDLKGDQEGPPQSTADQGKSDRLDKPSYQGDPVIGILKDIFGGTKTGTGKSDKLINKVSDYMKQIDKSSAPNHASLTRYKREDLFRLQKAVNRALVGTLPFQTPGSGKTLADRVKGWPMSENVTRSTKRILPREALNSMMENQYNVNLDHAQDLFWDSFDSFGKAETLKDRLNVISNAYQSSIRRAETLIPPNNPALHQDIQREQPITTPKPSETKTAPVATGSTEPKRVPPHQAMPPSIKKAATSDLPDKEGTPNLYDISSLPILY